MTSSLLVILHPSPTISFEIHALLFSLLTLVRAVTNLCLISEFSCPKLWSANLRAAHTKLHIIRLMKSHFLYCLLIFINPFCRTIQTQELYKFMFVKATSTTSVWNTQVVHPSVVLFLLAIPPSRI